MTRKGLPFFALGLMLCIICTACGSPSTDTGGQVTIATSTLPVGTVGSTYSYSIPATGGTPPYVWSLSSGTLPAGLGLTTKGNIHGTLVASGATTFTIAVQDSEAVPAATTATFSLTVESKLVVTTISLPPATIDVNYTATLGAAGGTAPYAWLLQEGNLPPGMSFGQTGVISGTPSATGTWMFTVQVTDSESNAQTAVAQLQIAVNQQ
jgi:hypothetical protein